MTTLLDILGGVGAVNDGAAIKAPCRAASTANLTLYGLQTVDGVSLAANDRVLVKNQTDTTQNGIYIVQTSAWGRAPDFSLSRGIVYGTLIYVTDGSVNGNATFRVTTLVPTIGSAISFGVTTFPITSITVFGTGNAAGAYTFSASEQYNISNRTSNFTGYSVYNALYPGVSNFDAFQSVAELPPSSTITQVTAVAGYVRGRTSVSGISRNSVALFGVGTAEVDGAATWGANTLLMDAATRTLGTGVSRQLIGYESDFDVVNPGTNIIGASFGGNSLAQPVSALALIVNTLGAGFKWTQGLTVVDGAATTALSIGASATSGANVPGIPSNFWFRNSGGTTQAVVIQATGGFLSLSSSAAWNGLSIGNGNIYLNAGQGVVINGTTALSLSGSNPTMASPIFTGTTTTAGISDSSGIVTSGNASAVNFVGTTIIGGGTASSTLVVESTYGAGTSDSIQFKTGSQVLALTIDTTQNLKFASASIAANGSVATAMSSLGPTGSHTTIQEWLVVKNASGVVRYIPMF